MTLANIFAYCTLRFTQCSYFILSQFVQQWRLQHFCIRHAQSVAVKGFEWIVNLALIHILTSTNVSKTQPLVKLFLQLMGHKQVIFSKWCYQLPMLKEVDLCVSRQRTAAVMWTYCCLTSHFPVHSQSLMIFCFSTTDGWEMLFR